MSGKTLRERFEERRKKRFMSVLGGKPGWINIGTVRQDLDVLDAEDAAKPDHAEALANALEAVCQGMWGHADGWTGSGVQAREALEAYREGTGEPGKKRDTQPVTYCAASRGKCSCEYWASWSGGGGGDCSRPKGEACMLSELLPPEKGVCPACKDDNQCPHWHARNGVFCAYLIAHGCPDEWAGRDCQYPCRKCHPFGLPKACEEPEATAVVEPKKEVCPVCKGRNECPHRHGECPRDSASQGYPVCPPGWEDLSGDCDDPCPVCHPEAEAPGAEPDKPERIPGGFPATTGCTVCDTTEAVEMEDRPRVSGFIDCCPPIKCVVTMIEPKPDVDRPEECDYCGFESDARSDIVVHTQECERNPLVQKCRELQAIVDKLSKTADDAPAYAGMPVYVIIDDQVNALNLSESGRGLVAESGFIEGCPSTLKYSVTTDVEDVYSTREAAEKARSPEEACLTCMGQDVCCFASSPLSWPLGGGVGVACPSYQQAEEVCPTCEGKNQCPYYDLDVWPSCTAAGTSTVPCVNHEKWPGPCNDPCPDCHPVEPEPKVCPECGGACMCPFWPGMGTCLRLDDSKLDCPAYWGSRFNCWCRECNSEAPSRQETNDD